MDHIGGFFQKYLKRDNERQRIIEKAHYMCTQILGVSIPKENISLKRGIVYIQGSSMLRHQIYVKKTELLQALQNDSEMVRIIDIQ